MSLYLVQQDICDAGSDIGHTSETDPGLVRTAKAGAYGRRALVSGLGAEFRSESLKSLVALEPNQWAKEVVGKRWPLMGEGATELISELMAEIAGLGVLCELVEDQSISEIMVNGPNQVWVERAGILELIDLVIPKPELETLIERMLAPVGLRVDRLHPIVDARLEDGSRVHVVIEPLAIGGPFVTIRKFPSASFTLADFCTPSQAEQLSHAVANKNSIVICGATSSGKTSLLNALAGQFGNAERIVTIEDTAELRIGKPHVLRLESRPGTSEGLGCITMRDLVRTCLRMRPDRIVVGEVRGSEALDMLTAMSTGHKGSLSTVHANSCKEALSRLETMVMLADTGLPFQSVKQLIASSIDIVVHVERINGRRQVSEILATKDLGGVQC